VSTETGCSSQPGVAELPLEAIRVEGRFRRELGDIDSLAANIAEVGLLHPIVVTPDYRLIAGARRLRAMRKLDRTRVPVRIVPIDDIVRGEFAENVNRKDFTPSEMVAIGEAIEPLMRERARERQAAAGPASGKGKKKPSGSGKLPGPLKGDARDHVARYCGTSGKTYEKARAVVAAADREPERFGVLVEEMDRTGRVSGVHKKLVVAEKAAAIREETPPLPGRGPYRVVVADPPWPFDWRSGDPTRAGGCPYPMMSIEEIWGLPVASLTHEDALIWLWVTNAHIREAFVVLEAWGFQYRTMLTSAI
jgi:hypothetical protein